MELCTLSSRYNIYSLKYLALTLEENKFRIFKRIFFAFVTPRVPEFGPAVWPAIANIQIYTHELELHYIVNLFWMLRVLVKRLISCKWKN